MLEYRIQERRRLRSRAVQRSASLPLPSAAQRAHESQKRGLSGLRALASRRVQRSASAPSPAGSSLDELQERTPAAPASHQAASELTASTSVEHGLGIPNATLGNSEDVDLARDRIFVEQELERYLAEDTMEEIDEGPDLYRYWAVSTRCDLVSDTV